ncbi:MAG: endo-1,4-beta-xylanase [Lentimonas sp.]
MIWNLKLMLSILFYGACLILSLSAKASSPGLKSCFADAFLIGTVIPGGLDSDALFFNHPKELEVVKREFNALTPENCMKPMYIQPSEGDFFWGASDYCVDFAESHSMALTGHTLIWHAMTADWVFIDEYGDFVGRELALQRMRNHIHAVVGRYKGRVSYWDVVNEAVVLSDQGQIASLRDSPWLRAIGEDYIESAFHFAHEADPDALLYYNDYNMTKKEKVDFVAEMLVRMRAKGVPIHGVGMQGHWKLDWPSLADIEYALRVFKDADIRVSITELDISVLPNILAHQGAEVSNKVDYIETYNPYSESVPDRVLEEQATRFREIFGLFLKYQANIERVTFWGTSDGQSWKNDYPVKGRTDYPLLFDRKYMPKPAYQSLINLSNEN